MCDYKSNSDVGIVGIPSVHGVQPMKILMSGVVQMLWQWNFGMQIPLKLL